MQALPLDSPSWSGLQHAYGSASNIPALLGQLARFPPEDTYTDEPWFSLWSSLYHQGAVYAASFAAVPHIVAALAEDPLRASKSHFLLPASVEVARVATGTVVPAQIRPAYEDALHRLPRLASLAARPGWTPSVCTAALAAIAAATGNHQTARLLLETEFDDIPKVIRWLQSR